MKVPFNLGAVGTQDPVTQQNQQRIKIINEDNRVVKDQNYLHDPEEGGHLT